MNTSKETERAELHKTIWRIANDLRGSVDGWDFKIYVLGMLFYRFISENLTNYLNRQERRTGKSKFNYANLSDKKAEYGREETVREKGFYILPSELFSNVRERAGRDKDLNVTLSKIFVNIEGSAAGTPSENNFKGLFDDLDVNSNKLGSTVARRNEKLVKLLNAIGDLPLSNGTGRFNDNTIDLFGDAYEYLMTMYAANAGKSGGEFFTPQEVSELLARITVVGKEEVDKVYDPACGSGSLLLKFVKILGRDKVRQGFFGQEINLTIYNLCRINMFLHNVNCENFDIAHDDTLTKPAHWDDGPFEAIVSNPPYSIKWEGKDNPLLISDQRYAPAGILAPKGKADLAFVMHILSWLAVDGTAAIVEFPGVLYRGGAERQIRQYLIDSNYIDAVIQLPPNLFFGTTIATCIIVLKKSKSDNSTLFIDASGEFTHSGNKNKLLQEHQQRVLEALTGRKDIKHFARMASNKEIAENGYNIAVSSYVEQRDEREKIDIRALNAEIARIVKRQGKLRTQIDAIVADLEGKGMSRIDKLIAELCPGGVGLVPLGVCAAYSSTRVNSKELDQTNFVGVDNLLQNTGGKTDASYLPNTARLTAYEAGDILLGNIRPYLKKVWLADNYGGCSGDVLAIRITQDYRQLLLPKFLYYPLSSYSFFAYNMQHAKGAKMPRGDKDAILKFPIPVPPLKVQREIVAILDKFDALVNSLSSGLPAEIKARRQQYEYYHNRLLTFKMAL